MKLHFNISILYYNVSGSIEAVDWYVITCVKADT